MSATLEQRQTLHARFEDRNRRIGVLRWLVPCLGMVLLAVPLLELRPPAVPGPLDLDGVRLESDTLVIDAPRFSGTLANGNVYRMTAASAETQVGNLDIANLYDLEVDLTGAADYTANARFAAAQWTTSSEELVSNEDVLVTDSTGAKGRLAGVAVDWPARIVTSPGPIRFTFAGGDRLMAQTMKYDMDEAHWHFGQVRIEMTPTPDLGRTRTLPTESPQ